MPAKEYWEEHKAALASYSDDPDTQVACMVFDVDGCEVTCAANKIAPGVKVTPERTARPAKYEYIMHAEQRVVANAAFHGLSLCGCTMYVEWFPCATCASLIVTSGIRRLVAERGKYEARKDDPRYGFKASVEILTEGGVEIVWGDE